MHISLFEHPFVFFFHFCKGRNIHTYVNIYMRCVIFNIYPNVSIPTPRIKRPKEIRVLQRYYYASLV